MKSVLVVEQDESMLLIYPMVVNGDLIESHYNGNFLFDLVSPSILFPDIVQVFSGSLESELVRLSQEYSIVMESIYSNLSDNIQSLTLAVDHMNCPIYPIFNHKKLDLTILNSYESHVGSIGSTLVRYPRINEIVENNVSTWQEEFVDYLSTQKIPCAVLIDGAIAFSNLTCL
ncbi:hypothetical protein [Photobacterium damselae]|uniref:hypothetical protein n=1 Tax=Photobacterium damselae TaxID=38293 RepID=UPI00406938A3